MQDVLKALVAFVPTPNISDNSNVATQGGLMSYGYNFRDTVRSGVEIKRRHSISS